MSFARSTLKSEARRLLAKSARCTFCESPLKFEAIRNATGNRALSSTYSFSFTSCKDWQRPNEQIGGQFPIINLAITIAQKTFFYIRMVLFINRKRRNVCSTPLEIAPRTSCWFEDFLPAIGNCVHNCKMVDKMVLGNFKGLSQEGNGQI